MRGRLDLGASWKSSAWFPCPKPQLSKLALLAGPRPLLYAGHIGRDVDIGTWIKVALCPRDGGAHALALQPGGERKLGT